MISRFEREQFLEKPLPSVPQVEQVVLGGILLNNGLMNQAIEMLTPEMFYSPLHRKVFKAMVNLYLANMSIDPILIGEEIKKFDSLEAIGGIATITNLSYGLPHFSNLDEYVKLIKDKYKLRELIKKCNETTSKALSEEYSFSEVIDEHEGEIFAMRDDVIEKSHSRIGAGLDKLLKQIQENARLGVKGVGLQTRFKDLDETTGGLPVKALTIVAARPSMGKTSLCLNIAQNVVDADNEKVVIIFSLEMSKEELELKQLSSKAKVNSISLKNGFMARDEWSRVAESTGVIRGQKVVVDDSPSQSPATIRAKCRRIIGEEKRVDLIIVDFLQLMHGSKNKYENKVQELGDIARELKALAKELNVPVIALSQLSRTCESRKPPKPIMSDLRESGQIEEAADLVMFIYREDYYNKTLDNEGVAEIIIGKNRNGPTGKVNLSFLKYCTRFENSYLD